MNTAFPKDFFSLVLQFAKKISETDKIDYSIAIFKYTPIYVRILGFDDENPADIHNSKWQIIMKNLPQDIEDQAQYFYTFYTEFEKNKKSTNNQNQYGCFSFSYHENINQFEVHFANNDKEGNLGKDRLHIRMNELKEMSMKIREISNTYSTIHIHSWLLEIQAFTRLLPPMFINGKKEYVSPLVNDNTYWGQFVDKEGNLKVELRDIFIQNLHYSKTNIRDYFPLKPWYCETLVNTFTDYYLQ